MIRTPSLPPCFDEDDLDTMENGEQTNGTLAVAVQPVVVPGILNEECRLTEIFYDVMKHNTDSSIQPGSDVDIQKREALSIRLESWRESLPVDYQCKRNFTFQTCLLQ